MNKLLMWLIHNKDGESMHRDPGGEQEQAFSSLSEHIASRYSVCFPEHKPPGMRPYLMHSMVSRPADDVMAIFRLANGPGR